MSYYPLFLDLAGAAVLVVGAGAVGRRKIASLLKAAPHSVTVLDPFLDNDAARELEACGPVVCLARGFDPADLPGKTLVFAATGNPEVNALITGLCRANGILCNSATGPDTGSFIVPAHFSNGDILVALSTGGQSPALARKLREDLEAWLGKRYTPLLSVLGRLRPLLLELGLSSDENSAVFRSLARSALADLLERGELAEAEALLADHLPHPLHARVGELLHELG